MGIKNNIAFGFSRDTALLYSLDDYSTPDNWHELGYELQYNLVVFFNKIVRETDRETFMGKLVDVFWHSLALSKDHYCFGRYKDDVFAELLENTFGASIDEDSKMQPPFDSMRGLNFIVYWDKGRFDLRLLKRLEDELNNTAVLNYATVFLTGLVIIPRSRETIIAKINDNKLPTT